MKQRLQVRTACSHAGQKQAFDCEDNSNLTEHAVPSIEIDAAIEELKRLQRKIRNTLDFPWPRLTGDPPITSTEIRAFNAAFLDV